MMEKTSRTMKKKWKQHHVINLYFSILLALLLCVIITPLLIRQEIYITDRFMVEEEVFETVLILALFAISFLVLKNFMSRLKAYQQTANRAVHDKSRLASRLAEAFTYIGKVNVELQQMESVLCGVDFYPQSRREFKRLVDRLTSRAMTIAATPWLVVRMIDRHSGRTINEHAVQRPLSLIPPVIMGNRELIDGHRVDGLQIIGPRQSNLDLLTVFILPAAAISKEKSVLLTAILCQIEMLFILNSAGCIRPMHPSDHSPKEIGHDTHN